MTLKRSEIVQEVMRRLNVVYADTVPIKQSLIGLHMKSIMRQLPCIYVSEDTEECETSSLNKVGIYVKKLPVIISFFNKSKDAITDSYSILEGMTEAIELDQRLAQNGTGDDLVLEYGVIENSIVPFEDPSDLIMVEIIYQFTYTEEVPGYTINKNAYLRRNR